MIPAALLVELGVIIADGVVKLVRTQKAKAARRRAAEAGNVLALILEATEVGPIDGLDEEEILALVSERLAARDDPRSKIAAAYVGAAREALKINLPPPYRPRIFAPTSSSTSSVDPTRCRSAVTFVTLVRQCSSMDGLTPWTTERGEELLLCASRGHHPVTGAPYREWQQSKPGGADGEG